MTDNELLSTADVAQQLGLKEGTIRAWLSRYPEIFREGDHHVTIDNKRFWTPAGVELLRHRAIENAAQPVASQDTPTDSALLTDGPGNLDIDAKLQPLADQIALQVLQQRLPYLVERSIERMLYDPSTIDDDRLAQILDQVITGLGVVKATTLMYAKFRESLATTNQEAMKQLPGGLHGR